MTFKWLWTLCKTENAIHQFSLKKEEEVSWRSGFHKLGPLYKGQAEVSNHSQTRISHRQREETELKVCEFFENIFLFSQGRST